MPDASAGPKTPLTSADLGIPIKPRYFLTELARYVCRWEDDEEARRVAEETAQRTLERECERGRLRGTRIGRNILIPRAEWERYVVDRSTLVCVN